MSTSPKAPRTRKIDEAKYRAKLEKINDHIKDITSIFKSLAMLNMKMGAAPKGTQYRITTVNAQGAPAAIFLSRSVVKQYNSAFAEELKDLKNYFRFAKKKRTGNRQVKPSEAKGIYSPVRLSDGLTNFFVQNAGRFGYVNPVDPNSGVLISSLTALPSGLALRNSVSLLIYIYIYANNLQDATIGSDVVLQANDPFRAFLTTTAPPFAYALDQVATAKTRTTEKPEGKAKYVKVGNQGGLTTAQILTSLGVKDISRKKKGVVNPRAEQVQFSDSKFRMFFIQSIVALNVYSKKDFQGLQGGEASLNSLLDANNVTAMVNDHTIINGARTFYHDRNAQIKKANPKKKRT